MIDVADQPITKIADDRFGRGEFAKRIAGVISSLQGESSIVVSVNAPWGEGKSSVLNMVEEELNRLGNSLIIRFNPWRFSDEEQLLRKYFKVLSTKLGKSLSKGKELAKVLKAYSDAITPLAEMTIPIGGKILGETLKSLVGRREAPDLEELKDEIEKYLSAEQKRIVIFMDDIDRIDSREIQAVFRLVKLTANFPYTAYILAFDEEMVSASLSEQFGGDRENRNAGRNFLEKIVQVPLPVPPADRQILRTMMFERVDSALKSIQVELAEEEARQFVRVFDRSFSRMFSSPRVVKRYSNMLNFALPILKDEVNMRDLILIEGVRAFYPKVYEMVRTEFGAFLKDSYEYALSTDKASVKTRFGKLLAKSVEGLTEEERDGAHFALQMLFPNIQEYGINVAMSFASSNSDDWAQKKRICASDYFRRYFNYGIPPVDISDREVEEFINSLGESDIKPMISGLETLCSRNRAGILIQKLRMYEGAIAPSDAGKLAIAISMKSDLIPESHPDDNIFGIGALPQAAFLLRELIGKEDAETRESVAKSVARNIERLPFAYEFRDKTRRFRKERGSEEFVAVVSDECEQEIARIFAEKLSRAAESQPLEDSHPLWKRSFYIEWKRGDLKSLSRYARHRLESHPEDVSRFLSALIGVSNDKKEDYGYVSIPEPDAEFDFLADILAPDEWVKFIRHSYPETNGYNLPRAVRWFVQMYERRRKESEVFAHLSFTSDADRRAAFSVWQLLITESKPMTLEEIASKLNLHSYAVSQILYDLIRNGFVEEHPDEGDGIRYSATN